MMITCIALYQQDSGLTLAGYHGEEVWLSGASPISNPITWTPYAISNASLEASRRVAAVSMRLIGLEKACIYMRQGFFANV